MKATWLRDYAIAAAVTVAGLVVLLLLATGVTAALVAGFTSHPQVTGIMLALLALLVLIAVVAARMRRLVRPAAAPELDLTPDQRIELRQIRAADGQIRAVLQLREWRPELTLREARDGILQL